MIAGGIARGANVANHFALLYLLTGCDADGGTVRVERFKAAPMIQLDIISIAVSPGIGSVCNFHGSVRRCENGRSLRHGDIGSGVEIRFSGDGIHTVAKVRRDGSIFGKRPLENAGSDPICVRVNDFPATPCDPI